MKGMVSMYVCFGVFRMESDCEVRLSLVVSERCMRVRWVFADWVVGVEQNRFGPLRGSAKLVQPLGIGCGGNRAEWVQQAPSMVGSGATIDF